MPKATKRTKSAGKTQSGNLFAVVAWIIGVIGPLFVIFGKKEDKFAVFHAKQALVLNIVEILIGVLFVVVGIITALVNVIPVIGQAISAILGIILGLAGLISIPLWGILALVHLFCAYKAYTGDWFKLPVIAGWAEKLNI